jgi:PAS domain S-box-containing protein/putative nucleotidyltransferase with HDIG domain
MRPAERAKNPPSRSNHAPKVQPLRNSELRYRRLFEAAQDGILIVNAKTGLINDVNPYLINLLGYSRDEFLGKRLWEVGAFKDIETSKDSFLALQKEKFSRYADLPLKAKDGRLVQVEFVSNLYMEGDEKVIQCNIRDNRARKATEDALQAKDDALVCMLENQHAHSLLIEKLPVGVIIRSADSRVVLCNPEASQLLGIPADQLVGKLDSALDLPFVREDGTPLPQAEFPYNQVIASGTVLKNFILGIDRGSGGFKCVLVNAYPEFDSSQQLRQVVVILTDINEIKGAEEKIRRQIEHLTALVEIDRAINFSFDLNLSLTTLLTHVIVQLGVDAADVLMFNPKSQNLEYVAGRGFHTKNIEQTRQPLGAGYAGTAALERRMVDIPDLGKEQDSNLRNLLLAGEDFTSYHGVPLIAKGKVLGVLEVFHRKRQIRNAEWLDFLKALASQAAIAIDNVTLFDNLHRSNSELLQAYDATIEGWSRAMELRDNETQGHTLRVAELTVQLARLFGLSKAELVQARRGALLHDIGKMGIPDEILLKRDTLTEAEWVVMKKHTVYAYEMLSPIRFLRPALDIPYAHHEKWDGSGYPLGLQGEQIPLVARIFAVADVWDALRSDRSYRTSWSEQKVQKHLRSLTGTHFDPHVVSVCLNSGILIE